MAVVSEAREERLAQNEVVFRTVNEQIEGLALRLGDDVAYDFVCECATAGCFDRIRLSLREYETIRGDGARFVVMPGHEDIELERVVSVQPAYLVVEKDGVAGLVAEAADPRG